MAHVICEGDEVCGCFEKVGEEGDSGTGPGVDQLDDLGDLDNGTGSNNTDSETFGDGEFDTFAGVEIDV